MENIRKVLDLAIEPGTGIPATLIDNALKEFDALKAAGIEVKIEQIEKVTVIKPKSKTLRGSYRPRKAKISS
jgi:hypothetical protein